MESSKLVQYGEPLSGRKGWQKPEGTAILSSRARIFALPLRSLRPLRFKLLFLRAR